MGLTARRNARTASRLFSRILFVNVLRMLAIIVLVFGEFGLFYFSLSNCKWPDTELSAKPTHILLLSDAQIQPPSAYAQETSWSGFLYHLAYELYLRRSWKATKRMRPNVVFFLGDMLADGKDVTSERGYKMYFERFRRTFPLDQNMEAYYLPGNNDIGMGTRRPLSKDVRKGFLDTFGPFNQQVVLHNHTFVLLDAPGLVDEDYTRAAQIVDYEDWTPLRDGPVEFVKTVQTDDNPVVLLSHIPLWRADTAPCGPRREKGNIHKGVGHGYQNSLQKHTTNFLIDTLNPSIIFSGDNRDYCEHIHRIPGSSYSQNSETIIVPEITVKSFSPTRHIRRPGFQLLSLSNPSPRSRQKSFAQNLCLLPDQGAIYGRLYTGFACLTIISLILFNIRRRRTASKPFINPLTPRIPFTGTPSAHPSLVTATWTPYNLPSPTSPLGSLPRTLRTPNAFSGQPTFRTASRPGTPGPQPSPLLSPMVYPTEEGEDDSLYPSQYVSRSHSPEEETWSPEDFDHIESGKDSRIMAPFPDSSRPQRRPWTWTWTFVFRGRRRRMTIRAPYLSLDALKDLMALLGDGVAADAKFRRRGIVRSILMDFLSVAWVFIAVWTMMAWWSFRD